MSGLFPLRSDARPEPTDGTRIVGIDEQAAGEVFEALASETTRAVLTAVYEQPGTASEIADRVDTSLQNAAYHLEKLQSADLVAVGDTWYSAQGNEMKVYAPTSESVVVLAGDEDERSSLREALARFVGAFAALAAGSVAVEVAVHATPTPEYLVGGRGPSPLPAVELGAWLSPGLLFFVGGLFVLCIVAWSSWR